MTSYVVKVRQVVVDVYVVDGESPVEVLREYHEAGKEGWGDPVASNVKSEEVLTVAPEEK